MGIEDKKFDTTEVTAQPQPDQSELKTGTIAGPINSNPAKAFIYNDDKTKVGPQDTQVGPNPAADQAWHQQYQQVAQRQVWVEQTHYPPGQAIQEATSIAEIQAAVTPPSFSDLDEPDEFYYMPAALAQAPELAVDQPIPSTHWSRAPLNRSGQYLVTLGDKHLVIKVLDGFIQLYHPESPSTAQTYKAQDGTILSVGRETDCSFCISDNEKISRFHLELQVCSGILFLKDMGSRNHSWFRGEYNRYPEQRPVVGNAMANVQVHDYSADSKFQQHLQAAQQLALGSEEGQLTLPANAIKIDQKEYEINETGTFQFQVGKTRLTIRYHYDINNPIQSILQVNIKPPIGPEETTVLTGRKGYLIGRHPASDLILTDPKVSNEQMAIQFQFNKSWFGKEKKTGNGKITVTDLNSRGGTFEIPPEECPDQPNQQY